MAREMPLIPGNYCADGSEAYGRPPLGVVFGTGQLATRFFYASTGEGLREICIEARHAQKILGEPLNKTDANGAEGLAKLAETGFYKAVRVKSFETIRIRSWVAARTLLLAITTQLTSQIRGMIKTFGVVVPRGKGRVCVEKLTICRTDMSSCQGSSVRCSKPGTLSGSVRLRSAASS